jgi:hypothetical protein
MAYNIKKQLDIRADRIATLIAEALATAPRDIDDMLAATDRSTIPAPALTCKQEVAAARAARWGSL